jgi:hypothetical protein
VRRSRRAGAVLVVSSRRRRTGDPAREGPYGRRASAGAVASTAVPMPVATPPWSVVTWLTSTWPVAACAASSASPLSVLFSQAGSDVALPVPVGCRRNSLGGGLPVSHHSASAAAPPAAASQSPAASPSRPSRPHPAAPPRLARLAHGHPRPPPPVAPDPQCTARRLAGACALGG